jgi:hypothetical protein
LPLLSGRDVVAVFPSGSPVLKANGVAATGALTRPSAKVETDIRKKA